MSGRLAPYVATDRLHALAAGHDLPARAHGAVLLADISGFTPLTEALVKGFGPRRGGEELTRHLNLVYGALNDEIERFGGSVIGFAGDAVTCWFDADDGRVATRCAWRLQALMAQFAAIDTPASGPLALAIKVAVAAGAVGRFAVGDPALHVVDVLCGAVLDRVAHAEHLGARGDVVVTAEVADACAGELAIARWLEPGQVAVVGAVHAHAPPRGWPALDVDALDVDALRAWLLPAVYRRLAGGQGDYLAELRQAAALFLQFDGLDFERDPEVGAKLDAYVRWVQQVVDRYEGALIQLTTGDKGSYLYAAFGAPVAHEDAAERAVCAALALRSPPPELGFVTRTRIGLSRGQMRTGGYGSERRRTYGVLGDETNVAARLMTKAATGQVLVSEPIVRACPGFRFEPLGELALKGKRAAVPVHALVGHADAHAQRRPRTREPLIGRAAERAAIERALADLARRAIGPARVMILDGDPGIGKSRLLGELIDQARAAREPRLSCVATRATAIEHAVPYFALRAPITARLALPDDADPAALLAHVQRRLPAPLAPLAPLLGVVVQRAIAETPASAALEGTPRAAATRRLVAQLLHWWFGGAPTALVIDDAHYLDSASIATLAALIAQPARLLVVLARRPHHPGADVLAPLRGGADALAIPPLSTAELCALVCQRLGVGALPVEVEALLARVAEGNPLFGEEIVSSLREAGIIVVDDGGCRVVAALDALPFPATLEGVVTSRIDRLPPAEQLTLKVASVIGRAFLAAPVQDAFPVDADRALVPSFLAALTTMDFTASDRDEARFVFRHAITQDVAYNLMLFEQRRSLHDKVADWYERAGADPAHSPVIAHHRVRALAGDDRPAPDALRRAIDALTRAGRWSVEVGATHEALGYLTQARALLDRLPESRERSVAELDLCSWLGTALAVVRGPTHADVLREFARARALSAELDDRPRLFETLFNLWYWHITGSERAGAREVSAQLLEVAGADPTLRMLAHQAHGAVLISSGEHAAGRAHMRAALTYAAQRPDDAPGGAALLRVRDPVLMAHCYLAWASWFLGEPDQAVAHADQALARAAGAGHPLNAAQAACFAALVHRYRRDVDAAAALTARAAALEPEHGSPYWIPVRRAIDAWVAIQRGDVAGGVAVLGELARRDREAGSYPLVWIIARADLIDGLARLGRHDEALAVVAEARGVMGTRLLGFGEAEALRAEAGLWLRRGERDRARACLREARALAEAQGARALELRALTELVALDGDGEPAAALRALYRGLAEGHALADLDDARAQLAALPCARNVEAAEAYVLGRLRAELSPRLTYHDLAHTRDDVVPAVKRLAARQRRSARELELVVTAAWFHDLGFIECRDGHEQVGIRIAREVLPALGYAADDLAAIAAIIEATRLPQTPTSELAELLADADLDVLGRPDFFVKNERLRAELIAAGRDVPLATWRLDQHAFVQRHRYFTAVARELRDAGKRANAEAIAAAIAADAAAEPGPR